MLTAAQQDYIETIYRLQKAKPNEAVRITDIAGELGTRLPTVTRTVEKLTKLGLLEHAHRQNVALTLDGKKVAEEVAHRHDDLVRFFVDVLGLPKELAEQDACQIEHGISPQSAQRFHEFLEYLDRLSEPQLQLVKKFKQSATRGKTNFKNLPVNKTTGWRR